MGDLFGPYFVDAGLVSFHDGKKERKSIGGAAAAAPGLVTDASEFILGGKSSSRGHTKGNNSSRKKMGGGGEGYLHRSGGGTTSSRACVEVMDHLHMVYLQQLINNLKFGFCVSFYQKEKGLLKVIF